MEHMLDKVKHIDRNKCVLLSIMWNMELDRENCFWKQSKTKNTLESNENENETETDIHGKCSGRIEWCSKQVSSNSNNNSSCLNIVAAATAKAKLKKSMKHCTK